MLKREDQVLAPENQINPNNEASENEEDQGSEYEDEDDEDYSSRGNSKRNSDSKRRAALNKPKAGGVLHGESKKQNNSSAASVGVQQKTRVQVKSGPVADLDMQKKRTKERTITEIIEKVSTWRKLYNGVMIPNKDTGEVQLQRWSLEDAAAKVKVSKKSLDDYLLQLRFGKKFGFDFEKHRDSKVGVLRSFVKEQKDALKKQNNGQKISSKSPLREE
jgi:hypothetical protein